MGDFGVRDDVVEDWEGEEGVGGTLFVKVVVKEEGVEEGFWAGEGSGLFITVLCSCSGTVVGPSVATVVPAWLVDSTTGTSDVVLVVPFAVNVVYPGSYVPLIPGQSMLKARALKAVQPSRRTAVASLLQSSVYIVTSSHHAISTGLIPERERY